MEAPAITHHRRPFLAPLWLTAAIGALALAALVLGYRSLTTTTIVLVRHAEKELSSIDNPPLAPEGEQRAERLARMFGEVTGLGAVKAVYVADARRCQQTAEPLATRLHLMPVVIATGNIERTADRLLHEHAGGAVLAITDAPSLPALIKSLADLTVPAPDYDDLYIVSVPSLGRPSVLHLKY